MSPGKRPILITGGAGFIGSNLAHHLLDRGEEVLVYDNLSRPGVERNLAWLQEEHPVGLSFESGDLKESSHVAEAVARSSFVFHLAGQVAVTSSLEQPREDCAVNLLGTLNVLEAIRALPSPVPLLYTSTNKVYGDLAWLDLCTTRQRYEPTDPFYRQRGISEEQPLNFHSPYGCSKGAADQYVLDYARSYGIPGVVFRMSCIYGPHQFGTEDQGWVAHFLIKALAGEPIVLYGDGRQVRDVLYIDDLLRAFLLARDHIGLLAGQAFNIGGGPAATTSLRELLTLLGEMKQESLPVKWDDWRVGDQRYFVSDITRFSKLTGWSPSVSPREGIARLYSWLCRAERQRQPA